MTGLQVLTQNEDWANSRLARRNPNLELSLLGGSWDLVTILLIWDSNPTDRPANVYEAKAQALVLQNPES